MRSTSPSRQPTWCSGPRASERCRRRRNGVAFKHVVAVGAFYVVVVRIIIVDRPVVDVLDKVGADVLARIARGDPIEVRIVGRRRLDIGIALPGRVNRLLDLVDRLDDAVGLHILDIDIVFFDTVAVDDDLAEEVAVMGAAAGTLVGIDLDDRFLVAVASPECLSLGA